LDGNTRKWDDLADQAADPADAAKWRKHTADLRAEAARARAGADREVAEVAVPAADGGGTETATAAAPKLHYGTVEEGLLGPPDERIVGDLPGARGHLVTSDPENRGYEALEIAGYIVFSNFFEARYRSLGLDEEERDDRADSEERRSTVATESMLDAIRDVETQTETAAGRHPSLSDLRPRIQFDLGHTGGIGLPQKVVPEPKAASPDSGHQLQIEAGHHLHIEAGPSHE